MKKSQAMSVQTLTIGAVLTALVIVLQLLGSFIRFGMFSITLVLIPIIIGAARCGKGMGAWLGFVFGVAVLLSGDAAAFFAFDVFGTIVTVLAKGTLCGFAAGLVYSWISKTEKYLGVLAAAVVCPVVNTGVFALGCFLFFYNDIATEWAIGQNVIGYIFLVLIGGNFLFELGVNIVLSQAIVRLVDLAKKLK